MSSIDVIVPARPRRIASSALREVLWAVCIFAVVSLFASAYLSICTEVPEGYWQAPWLAPSVMMAEGHGFVAPAAMPKPMDDFLNQRTPSLAPGSLPRDIKTREVWAFHEAHRYLLYLIGAIWWLFGVSWKGLVPALALLCGLSAVGMFFLCRVAMPRFR